MENIYDNLIKTCDEFTEMCHPVLDSWVNLFGEDYYKRLGSYRVFLYRDYDDWADSHKLVFVSRWSKPMDVSFGQEYVGRDVKWVLHPDSIPNFLKIVKQIRCDCVRVENASAKP